MVLVVLCMPAVGSAQTKDDSLTYALQSDTPTWDPPASVERSSIILTHQVFEALARRDPRTNSVVPHLASAWRARNDTTWEVKLRPGVRFHDGSPFTARDVKATLDRILDQSNRFPVRSGYVKIRTVEVVDDTTVLFRTDGPYPLFLERLAALPIQSEKAIEKGREWMHENPIGTGPYRLARWDKKREHILVRNDDYWGTKPAFKYVRVRIIPDTLTQMAELLSGGVDIVRYVPPDMMSTIDRSAVARTVTSPILRTLMLQLDQAGRTGPNLFTDRRVRQAANLAVDADLILKHVVHGLGDRTATAINPMAFGFDPGLKPYRHDVSRATRLLADAGYPNGVDVRLCTGPRAAGLGEVTDAIAADLARAGIRVTQSNVGDLGAYLRQVREGHAGPMFEWTWGYFSVFDADAILYDIFKCGEPYSYYCNTELDALILRARSTVDPASRARIYARAQALLFDDPASIYLWSLRATWGVSNRIEYGAPRDEIDRLFLATPGRR